MEVPAAVKDGKPIGELLDSVNDAFMTHLDLPPAKIKEASTMRYATISVSSFVSLCTASIHLGAWNHGSDTCICPLLLRSKIREAFSKQEEQIVPTIKPIDWDGYKVRVFASWSAMLPCCQNLLHRSYRASPRSGSCSVKRDR